ncbi:flagellar type III secretion system pore protein FliP [bacterium]|nr:flagellar type III secretion system pore protein FliP [bacterium]
MRIRPQTTLLALALFGALAAAGWAQAAAPSGPAITVNLAPTGSGSGQIATGLQLLALMTLLTVAPALIIMLTSFTRTIIVLGFVRRALGTQEVPPTQVLIGLALFLTFFVMAPTWNAVQRDALKPYLAGQLGMQEAFSKAEAPVRDFLFQNTRKADLALFIRISKTPRPQNKAEVPSSVLVPAFIISELQTAFLIGFIIYIPFLIIDMVVSSVLLSMGMMMLPPVIVSLPFKIILFVLVDGWGLIIGSLVRSFH